MKSAYKKRGQHFKGRHKPNEFEMGVRRKVRTKQAARYRKRDKYEPWKREVYYA